MNNRQYVFKQSQGTKVTQTGGTYGTSYTQVSLHSTALQEEEAITIEIPRFNVPVKEECKVIPMRVVAPRKASGLEQAQAWCLDVFFKWSFRTGLIMAVVLPLFAQAFGNYDGMQYVYMLLATTVGTVFGFSLVGIIPFMLLTIIKMTTK